MFVKFVSWCVNILLSFYVIRRIPIRSIRLIITISSCSLLTLVTCQHLNEFSGLTILIIQACWLISIRLVDFVGFRIHSKLTLRTYLAKILWIIFPILKTNSARSQWSIVFDFLLIIMKILVNHWIYRWCLNCPSKVNGSTTFLVLMSMNTITYLMDIQMLVVRILTRNKYTIQSFTNFPILSLSLGEFWGRRSNQLIHFIFKQSIYQPIRHEFHSATLARFITFIISGFMHFHIAFLLFNDRSILFSTFFFFFLHGFVCSIESNVNLQYSEHVRWFLTQIFLLSTTPLLLKPFIIYDWKFLRFNPPPLFNSSWIPQLTIPTFCP